MHMLRFEKAKTEVEENIFYLDIVQFSEFYVSFI